MINESYTIKVLAFKKPSILPLHRDIYLHRVTNWITTSELLPKDEQRVLCWLPKNTVYLPGKTGTTEERHVVTMKFAHEFFLKNPSKTHQDTSPHFWLGEGTSNRFFEEVTHWMPLPSAP